VDVIELRGLTWYGYHGAFAEEQRLGQRFIVDLRLGVDLAAAGRSDDLTRTVDYGKVVDAVRTIVEGPPVKLIEALAENIAASVLEQFPLVDRAEVRVAKPSAPVAAAPSGLVAVEINRARVQGGSGVAADPDQIDLAIRHTGGSVLTADGIRALLRNDPPLIDPLLEPDVQIQPNGVDVSLESVWRMSGAGAIGRTNAERVIPDRVPVSPDDDGWFVLSPGTYIIRLREVVAFPLDVMAFGRPRSSLLRCGAAIHTAVWDAGYHGRSEALMVVYAWEGVRLAAGARVLQLVFARLEGTTHSYAGAYQGENVLSDPTVGAARRQADPSVTGSQ
jgi:dUTP pyrophosphatase